MYTFEQKRKQLSADIGVVNFVTFLERFCFMLKIRKMFRCRQKAPEPDGAASTPDPVTPKHLCAESEITICEERF